MQTFNMGKVPPITFGSGRMAKVPSLVARLGGGPVLIVADAVLAEIGVTDELTAGLTGKGIAYDLATDVAGEPKDALVDALSERARHLNTKVVIAIGGGAAMDAGKLVAAIARSDTPASAFALAANPLPPNGIPSIAIPTTAGTGSEVTRTAVVSKADGLKNWFFGEELAFDQAVLDPELTVTLPPHLTAWTGIDAIAHALEGSTARATSSAGLLYGQEALRILSDALPRTVADGSDIEQRGRVLWASTVAGLALHNCNTHMGHNISHSLGSLARIHHGMATGLALEVSLPWLVERPEGAEYYARAAEALGGASSPQALPDAFTILMRACGIPANLPETCKGVSAQMLAREMKSEANETMLKNAPCEVSSSDVDELARQMTMLPISNAAVWS
ncbi:MAG: iron-containing alcohol dehydrogenase [Pseudomonadota bacterium]